MTNIQTSGENYLETIFVLGQDGKSVRAVDVAAALGFSRPSVSRAIKNLRHDGYVETDAGGFITLTASGKEIAETMYERHMLISNWLMALGVDAQTASDDACKMEHVLSNQSFDAIRGFLMKTGAKYLDM